MVRIVIHQTPTAAISSLNRLEVVAAEKWSTGGMVPFLYMLGQVFLSPPSERYPVIQFGPGWDINAVFRAIGHRQMGMVGPNTARVSLTPSETLEQLKDELIDSNGILLRKKLPPLFLALYLEQGGVTCWRHKPLQVIKVPTPKARGPRGDERAGRRETRVIITGLSIELKLDYVTDVLAQMGISEINEPNWAVTNDEISIIEARVENWGEIKLNEYVDYIARSR